MDHEISRKAFSLAEKVENLRGEVRKAFLEEHCGKDNGLFELVLLLIEPQSLPPGFMEVPAYKAVPSMKDFSFPCPAVFAIPEVLDKFRILDLLGKGAMGTVYRVRQVNPPYRDYALKIVNHRYDENTKIETLSRFKEEQAILSRLNHPNIPKIHRAGRYKDRPFFIMEFVPGKSIIRYLTSKGRDLARSIDLFGQVCAAVTHAHLRGIVHRDIKPENIVVFTLDGRPMVKLLDWGVAKQIGERRILNHDLQTKIGQIVGTPVYMAPETLEGNRSHPSGDIYALGSLFYELIAGAPFSDDEVNGLNEKTYFHHLRDRVASPPSEKLLLLDADKIPKHKKMALDVIVGKAMHKMATKRYARADVFYEDIKRMQKGLPLVYGLAPGSPSYRRIRQKNVLALLFLILIVSSAALFFWQQSEKIRSRDEKLKWVDARASASQEKASTYAELCRKLIIAPIEKNDRERALAEINQLAYEIDKNFINYPEDLLSLKTTISKAYSNMGDTERAEAMLHQAVSMAQLQWGDHHLKTMETLEKLAYFNYLQGEYEIAERRYQDLLSDFSHLSSSISYLKAKRGYARVVRMRGDLAGAQSLVEQVLKEQENAHGDIDLETLTTYQMLGDLYRQQGASTKAGEIYESVWKKRAKLLGREASLTLLAWENLGLIRMDQKRWDDAEAIFRQTTELRKNNEGEEHKNTLRSRGYLGLVVYLKGHYAEAVNLLTPLKTAMEKNYRANQPDLQRTIHTLGMSLFEIGQKKEGIALLTNLIKQQKTHLGFDHYKTLRTKHNLADLLKRNGQFQEAETIQKQLVTIQTDLHGASDPQTLKARYALAQLFVEQKLWSELLRMSSSLRDDLSNNPDAFLYGKFLLLVAQAHLKQGELLAASEVFQEGFNRLENLPGGLELIEAYLPDYQSIRPNSAITWKEKISQTRKGEIP